MGRLLHPLGGQAYYTSSTVDACTGTAEHDSQGHPVLFIRQRAGVVSEPAAATPLQVVVCCRHSSLLKSLSLAVQSAPPCADCHACTSCLPACCRPLLRCGLSVRPSCVPAPCRKRYFSVKQAYEEGLVDKLVPG